MEWWCKLLRWLCKPSIIHMELKFSSQSIHNKCNNNLFTTCLQPKDPLGNSKKLMICKQVTLLHSMLDQMSDKYWIKILLALKSNKITILNCKEKSSCRNSQIWKVTRLNQEKAIKNNIIMTLIINYKMFLLKNNSYMIL